MLDVNAPVLTRDGREARILATDAIVETGGYGYPICAEVEHPNEPGKWVKQWYTRDGNWHHAKTCQANDLVNHPWTPPPRPPLEPIQRTAMGDCLCLMHYAIAILEASHREHCRVLGKPFPVEMRIERGNKFYEPMQSNDFYVINIPLVTPEGLPASNLTVNVTDPQEVMRQIIHTGYLDNIWHALRIMGQGMSIWETNWSRRYADIMDKTISPTGLNNNG